MAFQLQTNTETIRSALNTRAQTQLVSNFIDDAKRQSHHGVQTTPTGGSGQNVKGGTSFMVAFLAIMCISSDLMLKTASVTANGLNQMMKQSDQLTKAYYELTQQALPSAAREGNMSTIIQFNQVLLQLKSAVFNVSTKINSQAALFEMMVSGMKAAYNNGAKMINECYPSVTRTRV